MSPEQLQFYKSAYEDESDVWEDPKGTFRDIKVLIGAVEELAARSTPKHGEALSDAQIEAGFHSYEWDSVPHPFLGSVGFERGARWAEARLADHPPVAEKAPLKGADARLLQIRRSHASARPKACNPAWVNTHDDLSFVLAFLDEKLNEWDKKQRCSEIDIARTKSFAKAWFGEYPAMCVGVAQCVTGATGSPPPSVEPAPTEKDSGAIETLMKVATYLGITEAEERARPGFDPAGPASATIIAAIERRAPPPLQVEPDWVIEYEASQDGCVQYTSPSEIMARAHAEAEGAWAFEIFEVKRRKLAPKEPKP